MEETPQQKSRTKDYFLLLFLIAMLAGSVIHLYYRSFVSEDFVKIPVEEEIETSSENL